MLGENCKNWGGAYVPLIVATAGIPLGIAGQNLIILLIGIFLTFAIVRDRKSIPWPLLARLYWLPLALSLAFVLFLSVSTFINSENPLSFPIKNSLGYLTWCLAPPLFLICCGNMDEKGLKYLYRCIIGISVIWFLIALSQYLWGWRVLGSSFVGDVNRPRGLYSHPLTFAYVLILFWPFALSQCLRKPRKVSSWVFFISIAACILLTRSRMVQVVAFLLLCFNGFLVANGKKRLVFICLLVLGSTGILGTKNVVSDRIFMTFSEKGLDRQSSYPDDRLAFWHAHWEMIKKRPVLGHGFGINTKYRQPYYKQIGLGSFSKPYEAHNTFIQVLVNGGIIGFALFCAWLSWYLVYLSRSPMEPWHKSVLIQTLLGFFLACLTQNGFQDASVRIAFSLLCVMILILDYRSRVKTL